ncbi:MAG: hypothetical protein A2138_15455 [Deltaproteobacteria bacterium RBG_16_71_12]|nr:MAG: hypothetical protein A2138_15455 [Deltaproteobacteria bacterium RBG_16_71_12]
MAASARLVPSGRLSVTFRSGVPSTVEPYQKTAPYTAAALAGRSRVPPAVASTVALSRTTEAPITACLNGPRLWMTGSSATPVSAGWGWALAPAAAPSTARPNSTGIRRFMPGSRSPSTVSRRTA